MIRIEIRNHTGLGLAQNPTIMSFLIRHRKDTQRHREESDMLDGDRDYSDELTNQGEPRILYNHQKQGERQVSPSEPAKRVFFHLGDFPSIYLLC